LWWGRPLDACRSALGWGWLGGVCDLVNPVVGFVWGMSSLVVAVCRRAWSKFGIAVVTAGLVVTPWTVRNYVTFGRLIPVKSNLAYELFQSQCLQPDGLLQRTTFSSHPHMTAGRERNEYKTLGEVAFLDHKWQQFGQAVRADPPDFLRRVADRFFGATLWYVPLDSPAEASRPWALGLSRLVHPLPFLGLLVLVCTAARRRLDGAQWAVIGV